MKKKIALLVGLCLTCSLGAASAGGAVWADRDAKLEDIKSIRLCPPVCSETVSEQVSLDSIFLKYKKTLKLDDLVTGTRPDTYEKIAQDAYLVPYIRENSCEVRHADGTLQDFSLRSGAYISDHLSSEEYWDEETTVTHRIPDSAVASYRYSYEYCLYDSRTHRPIFRYGDDISSDRSADHTAAVRGFCEAWQDNVKRSKKRR